MDWTDRHCRYFHRCLSAQTLLYTEMVTASAVLHGDSNRLLRFDPLEHPVALQLGGSDPCDLATATEIAVAHGYDEVNLNVGCPSDRVQSGAFGAVLMKSPELVQDCVAAMLSAAKDVPVTVKCRIGIDDQTPDTVLPGFLEKVAAAGVGRVIIHARKALLDGLSPKENRTVPPLNYPLVVEMKQSFPHLNISINGGIGSLQQAQSLLATGLDGVMIGRAAYHDPAGILLTADPDIFGKPPTATTAEDAVLRMLPYIETECTTGTRLNAITRHMLGVFAGRPGARAWRRYLSENAHLPGAGPETVRSALALLGEQAA